MFKFDWRKLVEGKRLDWDDSSAGDRPKCRILITAGQPNIGLFQDRKQAVYYNQRQDLWYRDEKYNVEIVVDEDLLLSECEAVGFASHHDRTCKKSVPCPDLGQSDLVAGSRFLSGLIARNVLIEHKSLRRLFLNGRTLHKHIEETWREMLRWFSKIQIHGKLTHRHPNAEQYVTWMLEGLAEGRNPMAMAPSLSKMELELALRARAAKAFGVRIAKIPAYLTV
jgi:hypothetical protein